MIYGLQRHSGDRVRKHIKTVTVDNGVHAGKELVYLSVDISLNVTSGRIGIKRCAITDSVFDQVISVSNEGRRNTGRQEVFARVIRMACRYVSICVKIIMVVQDMVCSDEIASYLKTLVFRHLTRHKGR